VLVCVVLLILLWRIGQAHQGEHTLVFESRRGRSIHALKLRWMIVRRYDLCERGLIADLDDAVVIVGEVVTASSILREVSTSVSCLPIM